MPNSSDSKEEPDFSMISNKWSGKDETYIAYQKGMHEEKYTRKAGCQPKPKSLRKKAIEGSASGMAMGIGRAGDVMLIRNGYGKVAVTGTSTAKASTEVSSGENIGKLKLLCAGAEAKAGNANAGAMATYLGAQAYANANGAEPTANAAPVENVIEANARAVAAEAQVNAGVGMANLGAYAGFSKFCSCSFFISPFDFYELFVFFFF